MPRIKCSSSSTTWESRTLCVTPQSTLASAAISFALIGSLLPSLSSEQSRPAPGAPPTAATRRAVWLLLQAELGGRGPRQQKLTEEDVELPSSLPALRGRRLRVTSACWDEAARRSQFRVECGQPGECLPFMAYVHDVGAAGPGNFPNELPAEVSDAVPDAVSDAVSDNVPDNAPGDSGNHASDLRHAGGHGRVESCRPGLEPRPALELARRLAIRAGDRAMVVFVSSNFRMTASVTCLEPGRDGQIIRVRNQEGHIFRARITGPALLEALPQP